VRGVAGSRQHSAGATVWQRGRNRWLIARIVAGVYYPENAIVGPGWVSALHPGDALCPLGVRVCLWYRWRALDALQAADQRVGAVTVSGGLGLPPLLPQ